MKKKDSTTDIEKQLQDFPKHQMDQSSLHTIHQHVMQTHDKKERRILKMKKLTVGFASAIALGLFIILGYSTLVDDDSTNADIDQTQQPQDTEQQEQPPTKQEEIALDKKTAREVLHQYRQSFVTLYETAGENGLITMYDSLHEVNEHFQEIMSEDLASWMVDAYINEDDGKLYLIAKDSPTWLAEDQDFELEQINDQVYNVNQERNNELLGHVIMTYQLKRQDGNWIVHELESTDLEEQESHEDQQPAIEETAMTIVEALDNRDMESLANYVHAEKGLLFSPYVNVNDDAIVFKKNDVPTLLDDKETYTWGHYDGRGNPIELTPPEFFDEFLTVNKFLNPDETRVNENKQRGNTINNIKEVFPNSTVVEFYHGGTEENAGIDWESINLVFEQNKQGTWKLVAIVKDQWTI